MRFLWSCVLATGLLLVGLEVYEGRRGDRTGVRSDSDYVTALEDGTMPPSPYPTPKSNLN
jgi:hypothetical protein